MQIAEECRWNTQMDITTGRPDWRRSPLFLRVFVFGTGAAVMAVEFSAERLMEPFFGNSQLVWASLIGLILLALSVGYSIGGRLADLHPTPRVLGLVTFLAGAYVAALPFLASPFLSAVVHGLLNTPAGVVVSSLLGTAVLVLPPVAALGAASPYAIRLAVEGRETAGSKAGSLYAWSTFGSLVGTFVPSFLTIPDVGVRETFWICAAVLLALGALAMGGRALVAAAVLPLLLPSIAPPLLKTVPGLVTEVETPYQFAEVYRLSPSGDIALSVNDSAGIQSLYTTRQLTGLYYDAYMTLPYMFPRTQRVRGLLIGMAAGTIPTLMQRDVDPYRAPVRLTAVEIDPELVRLGREYFHLSPSAARVVSADGRVYLQATQARYNLIIVDAYSQEIYIPFYLTTQEFFALCRAHLSTGGIVALNVNAVSRKAALLRAIERTAMRVFPYVYIAKAPGAYNELLVASVRPVSLPTQAALPAFLRPVAAGLAASWRTPKPGPGLVLTDNRAPVEMLTNRMILSRLGGEL